jgi:hypothetical protein
MIDAQCRCPLCGATLDDATGLNGRRSPSTGDVACCVYCLAVLVYEGDPLRLRLPRGDERADLYSNADVVALRQVTADARAALGRSTRSRPGLH